MPRLFIDFQARFAQIQDALDKIGRDGARAANTLERNFARANRGVSLLIRGFVGLQGLRFAKGIIDDADKLGTLHERTGIAIKDLAALKFAAEQSGAEFETVAQAVQALGRSIAGAGAGADKGAKNLFEQLGLKQAADGAEDVFTTLEKLAGIFPKLKPEQQQLVAMQLMNKSAAELIPLLNKGADAFRATIQEGRDLAPTIEENAKQAKEFNDKMSRASTALRNGLLPVINLVLPALEAMADAFSKIRLGGSVLDAIGGAFLVSGAQMQAPIRAVEELEAKLKSLRETEKNLTKDTLANNIKRQIFGDIVPLISDVADVRLQIRAAEIQLKALKPLADRERAKQPRPRDMFEFDETLNLDLRPPPDPSKLLEQNLRKLERAIRDERELFQAREQMLQRFQTEGFLGPDSFAAGSRVALEENTRRTLQLIDQQIAAIRKFKAENKSEPDKIAEADAKLAEAQAERREVQRKAALAGINITLDETKATKDFELQVREVTAAIAELEGRTEDAIKIRFEIETARLGEAAANDPALKAGRERLRDLQATQARIERLDRDAAKITANLAAEEERARIQHQVGATTELVSQQRISQARQQAVRDLQAVADAMQSVAATDDQRRSVEALRLEIDKLAASSDLVRERFEGIFSDASSSSFVALMEGQVKGVRDLLTRFGNDVARSINDIVARTISQQLFGQGGPFGGLAELGARVFGGRGAGTAARAADPATAAAIAGGAEGAATGAAATAATGVTALGSAAQLASPPIGEIGAAAGIAGPALLELGTGAQLASPALLELGTGAQIASSPIVELGLSSTTAAPFVADLGIAALAAGEAAQLAAAAFLEAAASAAASKVVALGAAKGKAFGPGVQAFSKGGVFSAPRPRVQAFAKGGVFNAPHLFAYASGGAGRLGVLGEEDAEAVLPLKRGKGGRLGVELAGGGGGSVSVVNHFTLAAPADARTQKQIARAAGIGISKAMQSNG